MRLRAHWLAGILSGLTLLSGCATFPNSTDRMRPLLDFGSPRDQKTKFAELSIPPARGSDNTFGGRSIPMRNPDGVAQAGWAQTNNGQNAQPVDEMENGLPAGAPTAGNELNSPQPPTKPNEPLPPDNRSGLEQLQLPKRNSDNPAAFDPHKRLSPTAMGQRLQLGPHETATERAVLLSQLLEKAQEEAKTLRQRVKALEEQLAAREQARDEESREVEQATAEVSRTAPRLKRSNRSYIPCASGCVSRIRRTWNRCRESLRRWKTCFASRRCGGLSRTAFACAILVAFTGVALLNSGCRRGCRTAPQNILPPKPTCSQYHLPGFSWAGVGRVLVLPVHNESGYTRAAPKCADPSALNCSNWAGSRSSRRHRIIRPARPSSFMSTGGSTRPR